MLNWALPSNIEKRTGLNPTQHTIFTVKLDLFDHLQNMYLFLFPTCLSKSCGWACTAQPRSGNLCESRHVGNPHAGWCGGCALEAHEIQLPEMAAVVKLSQQLGTESCVVPGNGHCEA